MSVAPAARPAVRGTFGGWVRPRSPGLGPLGLLATMAVFGGLVVGLLTFMLAGLVPGTAVLLATAVAVGLTIRPGGDLSAGARLLTRVAWWRSRAAGEHQYRGGAFARNGSGLFPLPGVLASTTVLPGADGYGNDFAVLVRPQSALYTVVLRCRADGASLVEADTVDSWVAGWGTALAGFGHEPGLVAAVVVVDTAPDPGSRLAAEVHGHADPDAPALARQVMAEIVGSFPAASSENTAYVAVTYSGEGVARRSRRPADIVVEIGRRVPGLVDALRAAGGGTVEPLGETEIAEVVHVAYDPGCALAMAEARMDPDGTGLTWDQAGPQGTQESWASYAHDSGQSVTWAMTQAPHGVVHSDVLAVLLAPHPDFLRKRVALVYRPHSPAKASTIAETDVQTAAFTAAGTKGRVTAASSTRVRSTQRAAAEVAEGAGMTRFATLLTVTVAAGPNSDSELDLAATTAENLAANARLRLRRVVGSQAAGFAATLPVGFLPWRHTVIPDTVRELL
jgi:hypothetical protein